MIRDDLKDLTEDVQLSLRALGQTILARKGIGDESFSTEGLAYVSGHVSAAIAAVNRLETVVNGVK